MIETRNLFLKKRIPEISQMNLSIAEGESYVMLSAAEGAVGHLVNIFSGWEDEYSGDVLIEGSNIKAEPEVCRREVTMLSAGKDWPREMKVGNIVYFFRKNMDVGEEEFEEMYIKYNLETLSQKRIGELEELERRRLLFALAQLKRCRNYIFMDFVRGMPLDFDLEFKNNIARLKKKGCSILYISDDVFLAPEIGDRIGFMKKGKLLMELKADKMRKMDVKDLYFQFLAES